MISLKKMIKLVAFDWNGTLIADAQTVVDCANLEITNGLGSTKKIDIQLYRKTFEIPVKKFFENLGIDPKLVENYRKAANIFHKEYEKRVKRCRTRKGTKEVLNWLKKHKIQIIIFSNHAKDRIEEQLIRLKIDPLVHSTLGTDHIHIAFNIKGKEKRLIKHIQNEGLKPNEVLIVGDTSEEIIIGKDMGSKTIAITHGHCSTRRLKAAKPDYLISNLKELIPIVTKLNQSH